MVAGLAGNFAPQPKPMSMNHSVTRAANSGGDGAEGIHGVLKGAEKAQAAPKLNKPVVMFHGIASSDKAFQHLTDYLASNGSNRVGGVLDGKLLKDPSLTPDAVGKMSPDDISKRFGIKPGEIYSTRFSGGFNGPELNSVQAERAMQLVQRLNGVNTPLDAIAHSKGGLDVRQMLQNGGKVDNLITVATPHQGSMVAKSPQAVMEKVLGHKAPVDQPMKAGLQQLRPDGQFINDINRNLPQQMANANKVTTIGGASDEALGFNRKAAQLPGVQHHLQTGGHGSVLRSERTKDLVGKTLAGQTPQPLMKEQLMDRFGRGMAKVSIAGGAYQIVSGLQNSDRVSGGLDVAAGVSNLGSGATALQGAGKLAGRLGGVGAGFDGIKDVYQGYQSGNTEKMIVGGLKTAAGGLMMANPLLGTLAYGGLLAYENREAIGNFVSGWFK
jgi:hypothetical protein